MAQGGSSTIAGVCPGRSVRRVLPDSVHKRCIHLCRHARIRLGIGFRRSDMVWQTGRDARSQAAREKQPSSKRAGRNQCIRLGRRYIWLDEGFLVRLDRNRSWSSSAAMGMVFRGERIELPESRAANLIDNWPVLQRQRGFPPRMQCHQDP